MAENNGKTALVIGGSRGIGRAVSIRLAKSGFDIWLTYQNNHSAAGKVKSEIERGKYRGRIKQLNLNNVC